MQFRLHRLQRKSNFLLRREFLLKCHRTKGGLLVNFSINSNSIKGTCYAAGNCENTHELSGLVAVFRQLVNPGKTRHKAEDQRESLPKNLRS